MERRRLGQNITLETRAESEQTVKKQIRYQQIIGVLKDYPDGLTAKQISVHLLNRGFVPDSDRNHSAPRLTELSVKGIVEPIGKTTCQWTGKTVSVYALREVE